MRKRQAFTNNGSESHNVDGTLNVIPLGTTFTTRKVYTEKDGEGIELTFLPDSGSLAKESSGNYA